MTKLDLVLERIRKLPQAEQDALAAELELILDQNEEVGLLSDEQWAEVEAALADQDEETVSHGEVMTRARAKLAHVARGDDAR